MVESVCRLSGHHSSMQFIQLVVPFWCGIEGLWRKLILNQIDFLYYNNNKALVPTFWGGPLVFFSSILFYPKPNSLLHVFSSLCLLKNSEAGILWTCSGVFVPNDSDPNMLWEEQRDVR